MIAHLDTDGEFQVLDLLKAFHRLKVGQWDGIVGSLDFPDQDDQTSYRRELRALAEELSLFNGFVGKAAVQSCGFGLWRQAVVQKAFTYLENLLARKAINLSRWGFHGLMQTLISRFAMGDTKVITLPTQGPSPNRDIPKMVEQLGAGYTYLNQLRSLTA